MREKRRELQMIEKKVTIAVIVAVAVQFCGAVTWAGSTSERLTAVEFRAAGHVTTDELTVRNLTAEDSLSGLSIGFVARDRSPREKRGRELHDIELQEVSRVSAPMCPGARFVVLTAVGGVSMAARVFSTPAPLHLWKSWPGLSRSPTVLPGKQERF